MQSKKVSIAGAGLVGSLLAIYLAKKGHKVEIFERRPDMRRAHMSAGKSINLALSDRGWRALEGVGIKEEILKEAIPMYKRVMHAVDGTLTEQAYGKEGQAIYSVSRGGLNQTLMTLAEREGVKVHFEQRCAEVQLEQGEATFENRAGELTTVSSDLLFGADGAFSAVRAAMQRQDRFNYQQEYIEHGYKELNVPANADGTHRLEKNALHIWPRGNFMMIALPNPDGSFTCTLFLGYEGTPGFDMLSDDKAVLHFFNTYFPDAVPMMPTLLEDFNTNPTASLVIIRCYPWVRGKSCLIGDAAHAIVPFYGQGMNAGFEDCTALNGLMEQYGDDWERILNEFQIQRKPAGDAIAALAMRNFVEMRDLTGDPKFLLQKKIEGKFFTKYPERWMPLYSMVTFSHIPYHEAWSEGQRQDKIMAEIMAMPDIEAKWDSEEVEREWLRLTELSS